MKAPRDELQSSVPADVIAVPLTPDPVKVLLVVRSSWAPDPPWSRPSETTWPGSEPTFSAGSTTPLSGMRANRPRFWPAMVLVSLPIHRPLDVAWKP